MTNLLSILTEELAPLREMYLSKVAQWSVIEFKNITALHTMTEEELLEKHGYEVTAGYSKGQTRVSPYIRETLSKTFHDYRDGLEAYLKSSNLKAEKHYENSLKKLELRIEKKEMDIQNLVADTKYSDVEANIEVTLTDGNQTVRARTIIASGPVQKPHYRYLVK